MRMKKFVSSALAILLSITMVFGMAGTVQAASAATIKEQVMAALRENMSEDGFLDDNMLLLIEDVMDLVMVYDPVIDEEEYNALYNKVSKVNALIDENSYYVSLGGSYVDDSGLGKKEYPFGELVADYYDINNKEQYKDRGKAGYRAEEFLYILDADFAGDAYSKAMISDKNRPTLRKNYTNDISKADLITVALGSDSFTTYVSKQVLGVLTGNKLAYGLDWSLYLDANGVAQIENLIAEMERYLSENGAGDFAGTVSKIVECYAYAYIGFTYAHAKVIDNIQQIKPDAQVIILGMYNAVDGIVYQSEDQEIMAGAYADYFVSLTNSQFASYAANTENTAFIAIPDVSTEFDGRQVITVSEDVMSMLPVVSNLFTSMGGTKFHPNAEGHIYIKDQIVNSIKYVPYTLGDLNDDGKVNGKDSMLFDRYLAGWDVEINVEAADVNGDGKVNGKDVMQLDRFLGGWTETL